MGRVRPTTRAESLARAAAMAGPAGAKIRYRLADHSGGRDPFAEDCASHWKSAVLRIPLATCDCAGFVAWCLGYDRYQVGFANGWDWVNCDSAIIEASTSSQWFRPVNGRPLAGDIVVYRSIDLDHDGKRDRVGHIGLITGVPDLWTSHLISALRVTHCSMGNDRRLGRAIAETDGIPWARADLYRGHSEPSWQSRILRYQLFKPGPEGADESDPGQTNNIRTPVTREV